MKLERVEVCLNCKRFVEWENVGMFEECEEYVEVECEEMVVVVELNEYARLTSRGCNRVT